MRRTLTGLERLAFWWNDLCLGTTKPSWKDISVTPQQDGLPPGITCTHKGRTLRFYADGQEVAGITMAMKMPDHALSLNRKIRTIQEAESFILACMTRTSLSMHDFPHPKASPWSWLLYSMPGIPIDEFPDMCICKSEKIEDPCAMMVGKVKVCVLISLEPDPDGKGFPTRIRRDDDVLFRFHTHVNTIPELIHLVRLAAGAEPTE